MNEAANVPCDWLYQASPQRISERLPGEVCSPTRTRSVSERKGRWDAVVGMFLYWCGQDKRKEIRSCVSKPLYANSNPMLKKIISSSWRLSINSQAGDVCPNACSHSWQLQGHVVFTTGLASVSQSWLKSVTSRFAKVTYSVAVSLSAMSASRSNCLKQEAQHQSRKCQPLLFKMTKWADRRAV